MRSATNLFHRQLCKPAFDHVQPRTIGRCEVHMKTRPFGQPLVNDRSLVRAIVVHDQVYVKIFGHVGIDLIEEFPKLQRAVTSVHLTQDLAVLNIQCRKQRCNSMTFVIMSASLRLSRSYGNKGAVRSKAWIWDFSSTHSTTACS